MNIVEMFGKHFGEVAGTFNDFSLVEYACGIMIGIDKNLHASVIIKSVNPKRLPLIYKTQCMSIECNMKVCYKLNNSEQEDVVHILRCLSNNQREKELFLELSTVLVMDGDGSEEALMDTFSVLRTFFSDKKEITDNELIGLYAELYTISSFHDLLQIERYWQSKDKMKFDFSIPPKIKLEIKATTKNSRTHHFRHEQLMTELYDIYILSYMLRYDDEGYSLFDLIVETKKCLLKEPNKLLKINYVLKNVGEDRLKRIRFNRSYTENYKHFYRATDIPKFSESTPNGVANAEYDCILDNVKITKESDFVGRVASQN